MPIKLFHIGEPLTKALIEELQKRGAEIPCHIYSDGRWREAEFSALLEQNLSITGVQLEARLTSDTLVFDPMHRVDVGITLSDGSLFPIEVKLGGTIYSAKQFIEKNIESRPVTGKFGAGSVMSICARNVSNGAMLGSVFAHCGETQYRLRAEWGLALMRDQAQKILAMNEPPRGLRAIIVMEKLCDQAGDVFEDIVCKLWPAHGMARAALFSR